MATDLARATAQVAYRDIGQRETLGKNDSPRIRVYGQTVKIKPPAPYCAAAVCTWIKEARAMDGSGLPVYPKFRPSARALGLWELNPGLRIDWDLLDPE